MGTPLFLLLTVFRGVIPRALESFIVLILLKASSAGCSVPFLTVVHTTYILLKRGLYYVLVQCF